MLKKLFALASVFVFPVSALSSEVIAVGEPSEPKVIITEIRLGGKVLEAESSESKEFVSIYNLSDEDINLAERSLRIDYAKDGFSSHQCNDPVWDDGSLTSSVVLDESVLLAKQLKSIQYSLTDSRAGSLRLVEINDEGTIVHDVAGWDLSDKSAPCFEYMPAQMPGINSSSRESLQRYLDCATINPVDTDNNSADFAVSDSPSPGELSGPLTDGCTPSDGEGSDGSDDNGTGGGDLEPQTSCNGVIINELLPNPAGADGGKEYIELHNKSSEIINLEDCGFQLNSGTVRSFGSIELQPDQYMAFYDSDTTITLPNSAGGTIYLMEGDTELQQADYPGGLGDDVAWAWFDDGWEQTYSPTPGAENIKQPEKPCPAGQLRSEETGRCRTLGVGGGSGLKPCRSDQFRNPLTNRCKLKDDGPGLQPCRADQFRNPLTNRCKLISAAGSSLKPCNPDQFRNPATNRCKKIDSGSTLKPCNPDQERNPETNRCRKVRGASTDDLAKVKDVEAPLVSGGYGWALAGITAGGVVAYGCWEWRRELLALLARLKP
jgi:hypothetical protein